MSPSFMDIKKPVIDGTRLRLNSLTGAYSAGNLMHHYGKPNFEYIFGSTEDPETRDTLKAMIDATRIREMLKNLNIASIGQTPQGFGFGRGLDAEVLSHFGANLLSIEARELMYKAKTYTEEEYKPLLEEASSKMIGLDSLPKENVENFAKLYKAYKDYIEENNVGAIASRCWPDFFTEYKTPVCAVLGMLNDNLVAASCESDLYGAISMYIGTKLTHLPVYFGDPVSLNEKDSTLTFWHCGTAACSLARPDTGATMGVHPNRKIGPTMEFGCKAEENVTIFRIGRNPNGTFRFFLAKGEAIDAPKQFLGTSIVVQTKTNSKKLVEKSVKDGWEPHFVVIYGDVMQELEMLAHQLEMEVWNY